MIWQRPFQQSAVIIATALCHINESGVALIIFVGWCFLVGVCWHRPRNEYRYDKWRHHNSDGFICPCRPVSKKRLLCFTTILKLRLGTSIVSHGLLFVYDCCKNQDTGNCVGFDMASKCSSKMTSFLTSNESGVTKLKRKTFPMNVEGASYHEGERYKR